MSHSTSCHQPHHVTCQVMSYAKWYHLPSEVTFHAMSSVMEFNIMSPSKTCHLPCHLSCHLMEFNITCHSMSPSMSCRGHVTCQVMSPSMSCHIMSRVMEFNSMSPTIPHDMSCHLSCHLPWNSILFHLPWHVTFNVMSLIKSFHCHVTSHITSFNLSHHVTIHVMSPAMEFNTIWYSTSCHMQCHVSCNVRSPAISPVKSCHPSIYVTCNVLSSGLSCHLPYCHLLSHVTVMSCFRSLVRIQCHVTFHFTPFVKSCHCLVYAIRAHST